VLFYNDKTANLAVDDEFVKLWRSVAVENLDEEKIEEYLEKQVCDAVLYLSCVTAALR